MSTARLVLRPVFALRATPGKQARAFTPERSQSEWRKVSMSGWGNYAIFSEDSAVSGAGVIPSKLRLTISSSMPFTNL